MHVLEFCPHVVPAQQSESVTHALWQHAGAAQTAVHALKSTVQPGSPQY